MKRMKIGHQICQKREALDVPLKRKEEYQQKIEFPVDSFVELKDVAKYFLKEKAGSNMIKHTKQRNLVIFVVLR